MKVQIWSDIMCPFCYIAKKNFEAALEKVSFKNEVEVEWKSFQLDPGFGERSGSMPIADYFMKQKGFSQSQLLQFQAQLKQMGEASGITFNQDRTIAADTFTAHKLLHLAKEYHKADAMEEALFVAHFVNGKDIGDIDFLVSLAGEMGLDEDKTRKILLNEQYNYEVQQDIMEARNLGISGVPYYVLDGKYGISGAQPAETFQKALQQTYSERLVSLTPESNDTFCDPDGCSI